MLQKSHWLLAVGFSFICIFKLLLLFLWTAGHLRIVYSFKRKICHCFEHTKTRTLRTFSSCTLVFCIQSLCTGMFSGHMVGLPLIVCSISCWTISSLSIDLVCIWWWEVEAEITQEKWHFSKWDALKIPPLPLVISKAWDSCWLAWFLKVLNVLFYFRSLPQ